MTNEISDLQQFLNRAMRQYTSKEKDGRRRRKKRTPFPRNEIFSQHFWSQCLQELCDEAWKIGRDKTIDDDDHKCRGKVGKCILIGILRIVSVSVQFSGQ